MELKRKLTDEAAGMVTGGTDDGSWKAPKPVDDSIDRDQCGQPLEPVIDDVEELR